MEELVYMSIDFIALSGPEGIKVDKLWDHLKDSHPHDLDDKFKVFIWNQLKERLETQIISTTPDQDWSNTTITVNQETRNLALGLVEVSTLSYIQLLYLLMISE